MTLKVYLSDFFFFLAISIFNECFSRSESFLEFLNSCNSFTKTEKIKHNMKISKQTKTLLDCNLEKYIDTYRHTNRILESSIWSSYISEKDSGFFPLLLYPKVTTYRLH